MFCSSYREFSHDVTVADQFESNFFIYFYEFYSYAPVPAV